MMCTCDNPYCWKCLLSNCTDDNCKVHTIEAKIKFKSRECRSGRKECCDEVVRLIKLLRDR